MVKCNAQIHFLNKQHTVFAVFCFAIIGFSVFVQRFNGQSKKVLFNIDNLGG
jgi:hypothetical protein